jgi:hypothetical protein
MTYELLLMGRVTKKLSSHIYQSSHEWVKNIISYWDSEREWKKSYQVNVWQKKYYYYPSQTEPSLIQTCSFNYQVKLVWNQTELRDQIFMRS